ncbi:glycoside hydrolase family 2 protein [Xylariaceae sp. FL0016]|nr:glycoside hydrolase family 2 protein [Xylariaceae sp. FL0016]
MAFPHARTGAFSTMLFALSLAYSQLSEAVAIGNLQTRDTQTGRDVTRLHTGWKFWHSFDNPDGLSYDLLKPWILPSANDFIKNAADRYQRPSYDAASNVTYTQNGFDDSSWEAVEIPHDWAIAGPFYTEDDPPVDGGMGRLPIQGVGWYRRELSLDTADKGKSVYLDIDGAMSYAMVWINGKLVGGWPYGYNSFRLDLTPHLHVGDANQLAIRIDNPTKSSRWYPGGGIYRNVWVTKVDKTHVGQWGTYITSRDVSADTATLDMTVQVENKANSSRKIDIVTEVLEYDPSSREMGSKVAEFSRETVTVGGGQKTQLSSTTVLNNPRLWGPSPAQEPNMYIAVTKLYDGNAAIDSYESPFGVRSFAYDANRGLLVNGEHVKIQGVNQHHDLGALGAAFNVRAAERQLEILQEMGVNAIRTSHNPPDPALLALTDRMGLIVMDEIFDSWQIQKNDNDFHLIFDAWHEADLRAMLRRDRNHPSIFAWSVGNEVGEQHTNASGFAVAQALVALAHDEEPTRPVTASMNYAKPDMEFPHAFDVLSLNYQGEGIRDTPAYSQTSGIATPPLYAAFHGNFSDRMILSTETASQLSTRGTFLFPVAGVDSAPVNDSSGGDAASQHVSAYELYTADFGAAADKAFAAQDAHPFVAGEFVWSGFDYLGEPTPYYGAPTRSSYSGIVDLAGFPKDRYYLYQARYRPELRAAHMVPHWTWPGRVGLVTPVHVFAAADEAELFVNGVSQGRRQRSEAHAYRFRWDEVVYEAGEVRAVTYRDGAEWATATRRTVGEAACLRMTADRTSIGADGEDLAFVTLEVVDGGGNVVPEANNTIVFEVSGAGALVATDNGAPNDVTAFPSKERNAFSGLALAIVRGKAGEPGQIMISASSEGLEGHEIVVETR